MNIKAQLKKLPLSKMNGQKKFLAIAYFIYLDKNENLFEVSAIKKNWNKSILKIKYSPNYYNLAQENGFIDPAKKTAGSFVISKEGFDFMKSFEVDNDFDKKQIRKSGKLIVFNKKSTFSFDIFLKKIFSEAKNSIFIVDPYFGKMLFERLLCDVNKKCAIRLIQSNNPGLVVDVYKRFSDEYKFDYKINNNIHDRFVIIDENNGYVIGPSMKDAADGNPALIVALDQTETHLLKSFFNELWNMKK